MRNLKTLGCCVAFAACIFLLSAGVWAQDLRQQFVSPPESAKPRVWWHWMNGNVSKAGIEADLRWMQRIGVGGLHTTDAGLKTPVLVSQRIPYRSQQWSDTFSYAAELANSLDLEFGIFSSPGWSLTGGPWVKPEQAMKKLVWSRLHVTGGQRFTGRLPQLPRTTGPFQNVSAPASGLVSYSSDQALPQYGADALVIAYKVPAVSQWQRGKAPKVTTSAGPIDDKAILDGDLNTSIELPLPSGGGPARIDIEFEQAQEVRSVTVSAGPPGTVINLAASVDGKKYRRVKFFVMGDIVQSTIAVDPIKARYFRFKFQPPKSQLPSWGTTAVAGAAVDAVKAIFPVRENVSAINVRDLMLRQSPRVHMFESKAGFQISRDYYAIDTPDVPEALAIPAGDVVDLSGHTSSGGMLDWQVPPGDWVILRLGYSLKGRMNHAASAEGTGLEVDKLQKSHVEDYFRQYLDIYAGKTGPLSGNLQKLDSLMMDSYEIGIQNWSADILAQFQRLRGYDPRLWLPTLTGIVIESARDSDRFLWDFRRTLSDLMLENHYKTAASIARENGLTLYGEALESLRWALGDDMDLRRYTDIPTAAMWMYPADKGPGPGYVADILGAASVAHLYGQNLVAVESLTSAMAPWAHSPRILKPVMDRAFSLGMNRPIIHASVHQPFVDKRPGFSLSFFGQNFSRHDTWAELAGPWMRYLARCSYLLQQGRFVADVAYFYGEEAPLAGLFAAQPPAEVPAGVGFDFVNADVLLHQLSVRGGDLVAPGGMSYRLLYLGGSSSRMTLPVLRRIRDLVAQGATVVGNRPVGSPSLADDAGEFDALVQELWGADKAQAGQSSPEHSSGVLEGISVDAALQQLGVARDFQYTSVEGEAELAAIHRRLPDGDLYFISNRTAATASVEARFRVVGREAEIWDPQTGAAAGASHRFEAGQTVVPLELEPNQSLFVLFLKTTDSSHREVRRHSRTLVEHMDSGWQLDFPSGNGSQSSVALERLVSWSEQVDDALRYFSGTAVYRREIVADRNWLQPEQRLELNLGDVRELAQVYINGELIDTLWTNPYRCDVSQALVPGKNVVEVHVTNLWVNRLIGDSQPGVKPSTVTAVPAYQADAPLLESGLLGPVTIESWIPES